VRAPKATVRPVIASWIGPTTRVIVIDDELLGALATEQTLTAGGYDVERESDGDAALESVRASLTRLVVSELYIPCAEGRCVVTALKQIRRRLPRLSVVVYTRYPGPADLEWALAAGADALVFKFADSGVLLREVGRVLGAVA
jgi:CheY-like chemotaxis protein